MKALTLIAVLFSLLAGQAFAAPPANNPALIEAAKAYVKSRLKDPYSAKFEALKMGIMANKSPVVCGTVNAKNAYGAYVGAKRFFYGTNKGETVFYMEGSRDRKAAASFEILHDAFCTKYPQTVE